MSFWSNVKTAIINFLYDEDRAVDSLDPAHSPEDTISGNLALDPGNPIDAGIADVLNDIQPDHTADALAHQEVLEKADAEYEADAGK
jgi:hypothetical protein